MYKPPTRPTTMSTEAMIAILCPRVTALSPSDIFMSAMILIPGGGICQYRIDSRHPSSFSRNNI
jgi:hypothetical protein